MNNKESTQAIGEGRILARELAIELSFQDLAKVPGAGSCAGDTNGQACDTDKCDAVN